jgi:hypothetical protein
MPTTAQETFNLETAELFVYPQGESETRTVYRDGAYVTVANLRRVTGFGDLDARIARLHLTELTDEYLTLQGIDRIDPWTRDIASTSAWRVMRENVGFNQDLRLLRCRLTDEYELRGQDMPEFPYELQGIASSLGARVATCDGCDNYYFVDDLRQNTEISAGIDEFGEQFETEVENVYCQACGPELWRERPRTTSATRFFLAPNQKAEQKTVRRRRVDITPYMGVELEVELNQCDYDTIGNAVRQAWGYDRVRYGGDGSLNHGIEFKTAPHTLEAYKTFDWSILQTLIDGGCRSQQTETCGVHVNLSRASFIHLAHEYKFGQFILRNKTFVEYVAQRRNSRWCNFDGNNNNRLVEKLKAKQPFGDKYQAVNWCNDDRVEIRVFKGTLKPKRLMSYIEFVHSVHAYTKQLTIKDMRECGFSWTLYTDWLLAQPNATYENIKYYLFERSN